MGGRESTERLISELSQGVEAVQPIWSLRAGLAGVFGSAVALGGVLLLTSGPRPDLLERVLGSAAFVGVLLGLGIAAAGALLAALAHSVPGRESEAIVGSGLGLFGMALLAATAVAAGWGAVEGVGPPAPLSKDVSCLATASFLALLPVAVVVAFVARGLPRHPLVVGIAAAAGTSAAGALFVHLTCPGDGLRHLLMGHAAAPLLGALLLSWPVLAAVGRGGRD